MGKREKWRGAQKLFGTISEVLQACFEQIETLWSKWIEFWSVSPNERFGHHINDEKILSVVAFCFGVGTEHENVRLLSLIARTAYGEGFAGRESGLGVLDWKAREASETSRRNSGHGRRTSRNSVASRDKLEKLLEIIADRVQSKITENAASALSNFFDAASTKKKGFTECYQRCIAHVCNEKVEVAQIQLQQKWDKYLQAIQESLNAERSKKLN